MFKSSVVMLLVAGCVAGSDDRGPQSPEDGSAPSTPGPGEIVRTRVYLQPDGQEPVVTTDRITAAEHDAELAARDALQAGSAPIGRTPRIATDPDCAGASLWVFDELNNRTGTFPFNHEICFFKNQVSGCLDLRNYARYCVLNPNGTQFSCANWGTNGRSAVASFYSGVDEGYFTGLENPFYVYTPFGLYEREDDAQNFNSRGQDPSGVAFAQYVCFW
jgi:hypothetical protein